MTKVPYNGQQYAGAQVAAYIVRGPSGTRRCADPCRRVTGCGSSSRSRRAASVTTRSWRSGSKGQF
jgi:hypothetical protein